MFFNQIQKPSGNICAYLLITRWIESEYVALPAFLIRWLINKQAIKMAVFERILIQKRVFTKFFITTGVMVASVCYHVLPPPTEEHNGETTCWEH